MKIPDELLSAFVNGELQGRERQRIELAIARDRRIAQRVARHRALRLRVHAAFDDVVKQPRYPREVPERKLFTGSAQIIDLARVRAERTQPRRPRRIARSPRFVLTISLLSGVVGGLLLAELHHDGGFTENQNGVLLARGALARALNEQIGSTATGATIHVTGTYRGRAGDYCRTFSVSGAQSWSGLACHKDAHWQVQGLLSVAMGSTDFNKVVTGSPLSTATEMQLRSRNWE